MYTREYEKLETLRRVAVIINKIVKYIMTRVLNLKKLKWYIVIRLPGKSLNEYYTFDNYKKWYCFLGISFGVL
jgi:hypothetical protein